jgi:hypothetical protein
MGSLSASGIPVVAKQPVSFRKHDIRIKSTDNRTDVVTVVTSNRPALARPIGSGSIVRDGGVVDYNEELVVGAIRMARTSPERIASAPGASRAVVVDLDDGQTGAVIPTGLLPTTPQLHTAHRGNLISIADSTDQSQSRVSSSGAFDTY